MYVPNKQLFALYTYSSWRPRRITFSTIPGFGPDWEIELLNGAGQNNGRAEKTN